MKRFQVPEHTEILKKVKKNVPAGVVKIDRVTKGEDGSLRISIKAKNEKGKETFRTALTDTVSGLAQVKSRQNARSVMLLDLDPEVTEGKVREVLGKAVNRDLKVAGPVRVLGSVNRAGKKSGFLTMPAEVAVQLLNLKRVGDRWDTWRVRDVVNPGRCFTCRKVGHGARDCNEKVKEEPQKDLPERYSLLSVQKERSQSRVHELPKVQGHGAEFEEEE